MTVEKQVFMKRPNYEAKLIDAVGRVKQAELLSNEVINGKHTFNVAINEKVLIIEVYVTDEPKRFHRNEMTYNITKRVDGVELDEPLIGLGVTNFAKLFRFVARMKGDK